MRPAVKKLYKLNQWLHVYLSMFALLAIVFFAVTGFMLNHPDWFASQPVVTEQQIKLTLPQDGEADRFSLVEQLRKEYQLSGQAEVEIDDYEVAVSFRKPGYRADVFIDREFGEGNLTIEQEGVASILMALHRAKDAGPTWQLVVDVVAIFLLVSAISGIVLLCFDRRFRTVGLIVMGVGLVAIIVVVMTSI